MIYTCTMNPAIDLFSEFDTFKPFVVNRSHYEDYQANGKAINISFMLKKMGINSVATGFLGGFTGKFIESTLKEKGIGTAFVHVDGITRINTFIRTGELEYKAVNHGPEISRMSQQELLKLISGFSAADSLFVSGSLPRNVDDSILIEIAQLSRQNGFSLILDVSSKALLECLPYGPKLIKPSDEELAAFLNTDPDALSSDEEIINGARKLLKMGARHIIVSRGSKGAIYLDEKYTLVASAPKGHVVNTACAGDTMLATFIGSLIKGKGLDEALAFATAAASSTAFAAGLSSLQDVPFLLQQVHVTNKTESGV
ncbi:1-phosphofructokinase [Sporolactobacillus pectinivorans]|uniref:1-phosphofructokinase n=1 Tax=Sporolactobacillus pectinivorans TaxID=1591408 RepID=UPI000C264D49|nr:1-phosphofructokinase [Sporolactobacillus pectinivorans]